MIWYLSSVVYICAINVQSNDIDLYNKQLMWPWALDLVVSQKSQQRFLKHPLVTHYQIGCHFAL